MPWLPGRATGEILEPSSRFFLSMVTVAHRAIPGSLNAAHYKQMNDSKVRSHSRRFALTMINLPCKLYLTWGKINNTIEE